MSIRIGIVGIGNCASSLIQGIEYYSSGKSDSTGLLYESIGSYKVSDIEVVSAFDIDQRKVGLDVNEAVFAKPNCTTVFCHNLPLSGTLVQMGPVLDGYSEHMSNYSNDSTFILSSEKVKTKEEIVQSLIDSKTEILVNYLPVGSEEATRFYAQCALDANVAFVNNIPVFIASDPIWAKKFEEKNLPLIGDDIKAQLGATITHRALTDLFKIRGVTLDKTYQLNFGGNTDFLNMKNHDRLQSKKESKTEAVQAVAEQRLDDNDIHVGPSDYVGWLDDNKVCHIRMQGSMFGNVPFDIDLRLSVEDSPNSAGVSVDAIRCAKLALDRGIGGVIHEPSAYFCKHPPIQKVDNLAAQELEKFISS